MRRAEPAAEGGLLRSAGRGRARRGRLAWVLAEVTLLAGPVALRLAFAATEGSESVGTASAFAASSLLLAAIWTAGGVAVIAVSGPDPGAVTAPRGRAALLALGAGAAFALACLGGGLVLDAWGPTRPWIAHALGTASAAPLGVVLAVALLAGAGEEVFFRLALCRLMTGRARWIVPTALYALATVATGNPGLVLVAIPLGLVATALWSATGRWVGPLIVHALWSLTMVGLFPVLAA